MVVVLGGRGTAVGLDLLKSTKARAASRSRTVRLVPDFMFANARAATMCSLARGRVVVLVVVLVGGEEGGGGGGAAMCLDFDFLGRVCLMLCD